MLVDSHAHLYSEKFNRDRDALIQNLRKDGVELVVVPGTSVKSSKLAVDLARKYRHIYATVGIHPDNTDCIEENAVELLRELAKNTRVVAIGECGLDYYHNCAPKGVQKKWFVDQIRLAKELNLPVVVHDREANIDTYETLKEEQDGTLKGIIHCYSANLELAKKYVEMGFYISIAGPVTYSSAKTLKEVAKEIPLEYLLIETDSPSLTPGPVGKKRNEPTYVRYAASAIAELKGISYDKVVLKTNQNAKKAFNIEE